MNRLNDLQRFPGRWVRKLDIHSVTVDEQCIRATLGARRDTKNKVALYVLVSLRSGAAAEKVIAL